MAGVLSLGRLRAGAQDLSRVPRRRSSTMLRILLDSRKRGERLAATLPLLRSDRRPGHHSTVLRFIGDWSAISAGRPVSLQAVSLRPFRQDPGLAIQVSVRLRDRARKRK